MTSTEEIGKEVERKGVFEIGIFQPFLAFNERSGFSLASSVSSPESTPRCRKQAAERFHYFSCQFECATVTRDICILGPSSEVIEIVQTDTAVPWSTQCAGEVVIGRHAFFAYTLLTLVCFYDFIVK